MTVNRAIVLRYVRAWRFSSDEPLISLSTFASSSTSSHPSRELKQPLRRQRQRQKTIQWFYEQNNSSARASLVLVHFFDVHRTTST